MRLLLGLMLLALLPAFAMVSWELLVVLSNERQIVLPFVGGTVCGLFIDHLLIRKFAAFETFEHELTHALVALLCLRRVTRFVVTRRRGGWVEHRGSFGGQFAEDLIGFAPYILPTFLVVSVIFRPLLDPGWLFWFDLWLGFAFGFHVWSTLRETREAWTHKAFLSAGTGEPTKSDLGRRGLTYSAVYICSATIAIHGLVLAVVLFGYPGFGLWSKKVGRSFLSQVAWVQALTRDI